MKTDNHRNPAASALRRLFQEQWMYFLQLLDHRDKTPENSPQNAKKVSASIETVVDGTYARMRGIGSYKKRLRKSVSTVLRHVEKIVAELPAAVEVNRTTFSSTPVVNALFVSQNDLKQIFSRSKELQQFFQSNEHIHLAEAYALLFVEKSEKTVFGTALKNDILVSDVIQKQVNFSEHQILLPAATEQQLRKSLETLLFEHAVQYIKTHMAQLHHQQMQDNVQNKLTPDKSMKNPEIYLQTLTDYLNKPEAFLQQQDIQLTVSKMGILIDDEDKGNVNKLLLNTVTTGSQPQRIIVLVRYPKNEMLSRKKIMNQVLIN